MKPTLLKILRHFRFDRILGIDDVETLWGMKACKLAFVIFVLAQGSKTYNKSLTNL